MWYLTLAYNAIKVSINLKGGKLTVIFIIGILLAEVVSKIAITQFGKHVVFPMVTP